MTGEVLTKGILKLGNIIKALVNGDSIKLTSDPDVLLEGKMTKILSKFIITPNVIIDNDLRYLDPTNLNKAIKTELDLFTAVYINTIQVLLSIYGVKPDVIIDKMGNNNALKNINAINANESFDFVHDALFNNDGVLPIAGLESKNHNNKYKAGYENTSADIIRTNKEGEKFINNYTVSCKILMQNGDYKILSIPVIIYPNIIYTDARTLIGSMLDSDVDKTFMDRLDQYRAGLISLSDLIFATDLVKKYREKKIKNKNDVAIYLNAIDKTSTIGDLLKGKKSFYKNFNIYIFDINKKPLIEKQVKGSILKNKYKDTFLDKLAAFSTCFMDEQKEELILFIDSIPGFSVIGYRMLAKGKYDDLNNIIKDLFNGRQPF